MNKRIKLFISILLLTISILLIFTVNWALSTFGLLTIDEVIYHFTSTLEGSSKTIIYDFLNSSLFPAIALVSFILIIIFYNPYNIEIKGKIGTNEKKTFNIYPFKYIKKYFLLINVGFLIIVVFISSERFGITKYINDQMTTSDFIGSNYVDPKNTSIIFPNKKRNLIYIYVESLETSYFSNGLGGYQKENLMPKLTSLTSGETNFSNTELLGGALQNLGSTWTIAGMVSQTAGIPIKSDLASNDYGKEDEFLPGAYSLGDILANEGYNQMLMIGSDAKFGGRKYYFNLHGNYQIYDYYTAINNKKIDKDYYEWWGYEDRKLYDYAKEEITKLSKKDEPFNFTMLTADTHFPDGYLSDNCKKKYSDNLSNVIACTDEMLFNFISWIKEQDFYEDTTIVISGDHLSMDVNFFKNVSNYDRTVYNLFINSASTTDNAKNRSFTTMDMFPTTLASMGVIIEGNKLGLGTNLFSEEKTLLEETGLEYFNQEVTKKSEFYNNNILKSS